LGNAIWAFPLAIFADVVLFSVETIRPFSPAKVPEAKSEDVANEWNISIARLGISPLYPPQEDFFVGDFWAIVVEAKDTGLIGRGIRIAHIDLSDAIKANSNRESEFNNLVNPINQKLAQQPDSGGQIHLSEIAFPGIALSSMGMTALRLHCHFPESSHCSVLTLCARTMKWMNYKFQSQRPMKLSLLRPY
jgi:hypothetical protein